MLVLIGNPSGQFEGSLHFRTVVSLGLVTGVRVGQVSLHLITLKFRVPLLTGPTIN